MKERNTIVAYFRMNDVITVSKTSPEANMPIKENDTHLICLLMKLMKHNIEEKKHYYETLAPTDNSESKETIVFKEYRCGNSN